MLSPLSLFAAEQEVIFRGQKIYVDGAELKWIGEPTAGDAELLLIYKGSDEDAECRQNGEDSVIA